MVQRYTMSITINKLTFSLLVTFLILSCSKNSDNVYLVNRKISSPPSKAELGAYFQGTTFTSTSKPNIFFILVDTFRASFINRRDAPNIMAFAGDSYFAKQNIGGCSSTHHSFYSLFFSRPSYERNPMIKQGMNSGSTSIRVLDKLGYNKRLYSQQLYFTCGLPEAGNTEFLEEVSNMQLIFATGMSLFNYCSNLSSTSNSSTLDQGAQSSQNFDELIQDINNSFPATSQFSFIYHFNLHDPYAWSSLLTTPYTPYISTSEFYSSNASSTALASKNQKIKLINSYKNAIRDFDLQFGRFIAALKAQNLYDSSIIVLLSDHGENFNEHGAIRHGGPLYKEVLDVPLYIKFPSTFIPPSGRPNLGSLMDVFPTIFDAIGLSPSIVPYFMGESFFRQNRYNEWAFAVKPELTKDTHDFIMQIAGVKLWGRFNNEENILESKGFIVRGITDDEDRPILQDYSKREIEDYITTYFGPVINAIFP